MLFAKVAPERQPDCAGGSIDERPVGNHVGRRGGKQVHPAKSCDLALQGRERSRARGRTIAKKIERSRRIGTVESGNKGSSVVEIVGLDKFGCRLRIRA